MLYITQEISLVFIVSFNVIALLGILLVCALTAIILTFGIEYMTREAFAGAVISNLMAFSASIICFIVADAVGLIFIC
jgi:NADH:ubiquinone oxidoreductase subunit 5 (subunit L)/multisubunit Na+/H+ antiporter MnhA subunit